MKKILFIRLNDTPFGGAQRYMKRLVDELGKRGFEIDTVFSPYSNTLPSWLRVLLFDRFVSKLRAREKDTIFFSLERVSSTDIYRAGDGVHKAFLKTKGFSLNPLHLSYLYLEKRCFNNSKKIIANSKRVKEEIIEYYGIDENKIEVIYNGVNLPSKIDKDGAKLKLSQEFGIDRDTPIILYVGSGFERKGVAQFLEIISKLESEFVAFVVGKEKRLDRYKKLAKDLRVEQKVIFTGARSDVEEFYSASDIFLFPTKYEPFSNVVLEALSYGSVVFTTVQNGASEILDSYFVMESPNDIEIYKKIDKLLSDRERLLKLQEESIKLSKEFSIEQNAKETVRVIESI